MSALRVVRLQQLQTQLTRFDLFKNVQINCIFAQANERDDGCGKAFSSSSVRRTTTTAYDKWSFSGMAAPLATHTRTHTTPAAHNLKWSMSTGADRPIIRCTPASASSPLRRSRCENPVAFAHAGSVTWPHGTHALPSPAMETDRFVKHSQERPFHSLESFILLLLDIVIIIVIIFIIIIIVVVVFIFIFE